MSDVIARRVLVSSPPQGQDIYIQDVGHFTRMSPFKTSSVM